MTTNSILVVGRLGDDPKLTFTQSGIARCTFSVAVTERRRDAAGNWEDGDTTWYDVVAWRKAAENFCESASKGDLAMVYGPMKSRTYETDAGEKRKAWEITANELGLSVANATLNVTRASGGGGGYNQAPRQQAAPQPAPVAAAGGDSYDDTYEPF